MRPDGFLSSSLERRSLESEATTSEPLPGLYFSGHFLTPLNGRRQISKEGQENDGWTRSQDRRLRFSQAGPSRLWTFCVMCSSGPFEGRLVVSHCADLSSCHGFKIHPSYKTTLSKVVSFSRRPIASGRVVLSCTVVDEFCLTQEEADQYHYLQAHYQCRQAFARPHPPIANALWHSPTSISFLTNMDPSETSCTSTPT